MLDIMRRTYSKILEINYFHSLITRIRIIILVFVENWLLFYRKLKRKYIWLKAFDFQCQLQRKFISQWIFRTRNKMFWLINLKSNEWIFSHLQKPRSAKSKVKQELAQHHSLNVMKERTLEEHWSASLSHVALLLQVLPKHHPVQPRLRLKNSFCINIQNNVPYIPFSLIFNQKSGVIISNHVFQNVHKLSVP